MFKSSSILAIGLAVMTVGASAVCAQQTQSQLTQPSNNGYLPWRGGGFGGPAVYSINSSSPSATQEQIYDLAPAMGNAAFAETEYQNRCNALQIMLARARADFRNSPDFVAAKNELEDAQRAYDDARETVLSKLRQDSQYVALVTDKTQQEVAMSGLSLESPRRLEIAETKLEYGVQVTLLEAKALENDSTFVDARTRLIAAHRTVTDKQRQFESALYHQPEVVAARQQVDSARSNMNAADAYLYGAELARTDLNYLNNPSSNGNLVAPPWGGYWGGGMYRVNGF